MSIKVIIEKELIIDDLDICRIDKELSQMTDDEIFDLVNTLITEYPMVFISNTEISIVR